MSVYNYYNKVAKLYDYGFNVGSFWLMRRYQREAVNELNLKKGDIVIDLGCGTGLLFKFLLDKIGKTGQIIGIDISSGMLEIAKNRVKKNNWGNIELIQADLSKANLNLTADSAIFSLVLSLIPNYEEAIKNSLSLLKLNAPIVIADSWKKYYKWHHKLTNKLIDLKAPLVHSDPNNKIYEILPKYLDNITIEDKLLGLYSIAKGYSK